MHQSFDHANRKRRRLTFSNISVCKIAGKWSPSSWLYVLSKIGSASVLGGAGSGRFYVDYDQNSSSSSSSSLLFLLLLLLYSWILKYRACTDCAQNISTDLISWKHMRRCVCCCCHCSWQADFDRVGTKQVPSQTTEMFQCQWGLRAIQ